MLEKIVILNNTPNFKIKVKITNYHKIYPKFILDKIVGIFNLLLRLLTFLYESKNYIPPQSDDDDGYSYSPNINKRKIIFQKIYDLSGLIYKDELYWGSSLCLHYAYDVTDDDKEMMGEQI